MADQNVVVPASALKRHHNTTHGMGRTAEYGAWRAMKKRCLNPKHPAYLRYGGRGITICQAWIVSFESFFADLGPKPSKRHTLERLNNEAGYTPANCAWRIWEHQNRNRRNTVMVEYLGVSCPLAEVAELTGTDYYLLHRRVRDLGWDLQKAISKPSCRK